MVATHEHDDQREVLVHVSLPQPPWDVVPEFCFLFFCLLSFLARRNIFLYIVHGPTQTSQNYGGAGGGACGGTCGCTLPSGFRRFCVMRNRIPLIIALQVPDIISGTCNVMMRGMRL